MEKKNKRRRIDRKNRTSLYSFCFSPIRKEDKQKIYGIFLEGGGCLLSAHTDIISILLFFKKKFKKKEREKMLLCGIPFD
jgi:hypothetical protein